MGYRVIYIGIQTRFITTGNVKEVLSIHSSRTRIRQGVPNLCVMCRWVFSFTPRPLFFLTKAPPRAFLIWGWVDAEACPFFWRAIKYLVFARNRTAIVGIIQRVVDATPTAQSGLLVQCCRAWYLYCLCSYKLRRFQTLFTATCGWNSQI